MDDADHIAFFGQNMAGRGKVESGHRALFAMVADRALPSSGGPAPKIRFLRPDVAVIVTTGGAPGDDAPQSVITLTSVRDEGRWRFASIQSTRVTLPSGAPS